MKKILFSLICCGIFGVAHADPALMKGFIPGGSGVLDVKSRTPSGQPLFDASGRPTGNMSPAALYSGFVSAATVTSPGAYAPADLPLALTVAGNALGQTAQLVPTGYTVTSATVVAAGNACPASSIFTLASTGTKIIVSDGNGLSGSVVTVSVGGTAASASDVPANPVALTSIVSGCTPPQFTLGWGLAGVSVQLPGWGYTAAPSVTAPASSLSGGAAASVLTQVQTGPVNLASQMLPSSALGTQAVSFAQGNASAASSLASGTMRARSFARRGADFINMADSLVLNGHGNSSGDPSPNTDPSVWQALRNQWGGDKIVTLPSGYIPPSDLNAYAIEAPTAPDASNKNIFYFAPSGLSVLGANGGTYGRTLIDTDNDTTITPFNGSLNIEKHTITAAQTRPIINLVYENSSPNIAQTGGGGMFAKLPPINVSAYQDPGAYGSLTGMSFWLVDQAGGVNAPMLNQAQIFDGTIIRDGRSSTWGISVSHRDTTGTASDSFAQTYAELDGSANGADGGNPVYSPGDGNRKGIWVQSGSENFHIEGTGKNATLIENANWAAGASFAVGQRIRVVASDGKFHLYDVSTAGTTGTSAPVWSISDGATVTDGSVTWTHLGQFNAGFSKAFFVDGNNYYGDGDSWFDTILTSNNNVYGAFVDASQVHFIDPTSSFTVQTDSNGNPVSDGHGGIKYNYTASPYGAVVRMAADMNIDFSADGTQAGLNKRKMSYVSADKALEYHNPAGIALKVGDDGSVTTVGVTTLGTGGQAILHSSTAYSFAAGTIGSNLWNTGNNDTDILGGEGGLMFGTVKWQDGHPNSTPALEIQNNNHVVFHDVAQLATMTRSAVLALASPQEGQKVYDIDDHVEVTYRCPGGTSCGWFPTQYGTAISN